MARRLAVERAIISRNQILGERQLSGKPARLAPELRAHPLALGGEFFVAAPRGFRIGSGGPVHLRPRCLTPVSDADAATHQAASHRRQMGVTAPRRKMRKRFAAAAPSATIARGAFMNCASSAHSSLWMAGVSKARLCVRAADEIFMCDPHAAVKAAVKIAVCAFTPCDTTILPLMRWTS